MSVLINTELHLYFDLSFLNEPTCSCGDAADSPGSRSCILDSHLDTDVALITWLEVVPNRQFY